MLRNTCANGIQMKNAMIFYSVDISNKYTFYAAMAVSRECDCGAKGPKFKPITSLLLAQNLRTGAS